VIEMLEQLAVEVGEGRVGGRVRIGIHAVRHERPVPEVSIDVLGQRGRGRDENEAREKSHREQRGKRGESRGPVRAQDAPCRDQVGDMRHAPEKEHGLRVEAQVPEQRHAQKGGDEQNSRNEERQ